MRNMRRCVAIAIVMVFAASPVAAQDGSADRPTHRVSVHAEAIAAGVTYVYALSPRWGLGVSVTGGRHLGVTLDDPSDLDAWVTAYATVEIRLAPRLAMMLEPVGGAAVVGNDFGTVYPSAGAEVRASVGSFRIGSRLRVVRIAGGNGSGDYWVQWVPLRVGLALGG